MLGKTSKPVIEILTGSLVSGNISGLLEFASSPRSHVESPKALKKSFDLGGVGLGIITALENSDSRALFGRNLGRSSPIPVQNSPGKAGRVSEEVTESGSLEEYYTVVTCHRPHKSYTKVYSGDDHRPPFRIQKSSRPSVFHISPVGYGECAGIPPPEFLSSCSLCDKSLHGEDIYMYRGERGFCSPECRYKQIVSDEWKEKCRSEATRTTPVAEVSGTPYAAAAASGQILTTGILAI